MRSLIGFSLFLVLVGGICSSIFHLDRDGYFNLNDFEITVTGQEIDSAYLAPLLQDLRVRLDAYKGHSLFELPLSEIRDSFSEQAWIENVSILRRWPNQILLTVQPRRVILAYIDKNGATQLLDDDGDSLGPADSRNIPNVAIATGKEFEERPELRQKAVQLLGKLPEKGGLSRESVSTMHYHHSHGFWLSLIDDGLKVRMGEDDFEKKSRRVGQVIRYLKTNRYQGEMIDANFDKKVLVRLKNK